MIVECYQPDLLQASHRQWMIDRRKGKSLVAPPETLVAMTETLSNPEYTQIPAPDHLTQSHRGGRLPRGGAAMKIDQEGRMTIKHLAGQEMPVREIARLLGR